MNTVTTALSQSQNGLADYERNAQFIGITEGRIIRYRNKIILKGRILHPYNLEALDLQTDH